MTSFRDEVAKSDGTTLGTSWAEEESPVIAGELLRYEKATTRYGEAVIAVIRDDKLGEVSVWLTPTVLKSRFADARPVPGEVVGIKYLGKHPVKNYKQYSVLVQGRSGISVDWAKLEDDAPFTGEDFDDFEDA